MPVNSVDVCLSQSIAGVPVLMQNNYLFVHHDCRHSTDHSMFSTVAELCGGLDGDGLSWSIVLFDATVPIRAVSAYRGHPMRECTSSLAPSRDTLTFKKDTLQFFS
jgi:hypothetical protein